MLLSMIRVKDILKHDKTDNVCVNVVILYLFIARGGIPVLMTIESYHCSYIIHESLEVYES
jgi:hypothetical protein